MFFYLRTYFVIVLLCLLFQIQSFAQTANTQPDSNDIPNENKTKIINKSSDELIHFGDLIEIDVIGSSEFDWRGTVNPEGFLDGVDFIDEPIQALCRDEASVAEDVAKSFSKILRNPQVTVKVLDRSGRPISYLYGAVRTPQRFKLNREIRLNELIILSGGITEKAGGEIEIIRSSFFDCVERQKFTEPENPNLKIKQETGTKTFKIKISDLIKGTSEANPVILTGDIVTIVEAEPIYIIGGVVNPRQINSASKMTLSRAIASAGGFTKDADKKNILIFRRENNARKLIEVNFDEIESNKIADLELEKFDIIDISQRGRDKRTVSPIVRNYDVIEKRISQLPLRIIE